jgi:predicted CoA-binding protein
MTDSNAGHTCPLPSSTLAHDALSEDDQEMVELLAHVRTVAVVGASPNPDRTSHQIAQWLMANTPYQIYLVNPAAGDAEIRGHGFYDSLSDLPVAPDLVDVFRRSEHVPPIAQEAIEVGSVGLWLQLGVINNDAADAALDAGMSVVQDNCLKVAYSRLRTAIEAERAAGTEPAPAASGAKHE